MFKWKDRKPIFLKSSLHSPSDVVSVKRKEKDESITIVPCPAVLNYYYTNMNFVDIFDWLKLDYK